MFHQLTNAVGVIVYNTSLSKITSVSVMLRHPSRVSRHYRDNDVFFNISCSAHCSLEKAEPLLLSQISRPLKL